mgnify:CR=1 FL=1
MINTRLRLLVARVSFLLLFVACPALVAWWWLTPSPSDLAAEKRLLGKWELRGAESDPILEPPVRIIEWLPNGQSAHYSPEMESRGRTDEKIDSYFDWRIRDGTLITRMRTPETRGTIAQHFKLDWIDSDNLRLTLDSRDSIDGKPFTMCYRRFAPDPSVLPKLDEPQMAR